jgi:hypothetical protein
MAHLTVAASESLFRDMFAALRDNFSVTASDSGSLGPFSAGYSVGVRLENGTVDLRNDGTIKVSELDIVYDPFDFFLGFDLDEQCIGGWCILGIPFDGCAVRLPKWCIFSDNPDIKVDLDLSGVINSEISFTASLLTNYRVDPARTPGMSDLDAEDANIPNRWQVFLDPQTIDLDIFDIADIVGNLLEQAMDAAIDTLLAPFPGWVRSAIKAIFGPLIDFIRGLLDLLDDIGEWLSDLLNVSLGFINTILTLIADYFAAQYPIFKFEDPYPILPPVGGLIPVKLPIRDFTVTVNTDEMIVEANVGA